MIGGMTIGGLMIGGRGGMTIGGLMIGGVRLLGGCEKGRAVACGLSVLAVIPLLFTIDERLKLGDKVTILSFLEVGHRSHSWA